jgi:hypothetical protein
MNYTALISGLVGAVIGALSSLLTLVVQNVYQNRRESTRLLFETAYKDYELRVLHLPENRAAFPVILAYHQQMMSLIDKGELTPASMKEVFDKQAAMNAEVLHAADRPRGSASPSEGKT